MPRDRHRSGNAGQWLARADGDLALAKAPLPKGGFYEDLCFHAQQAAEKAIKAVYIRAGLSFQYTHDLDELLKGLKESGMTVPESVKECIVLTSYAWEARYPGVVEPVTEEEYREAVAMAERVVEWAHEVIDQKSNDE